MGRGRAKAKQTKVARDLKYQDVSPDYAALQRELAAGGNGSYASAAPEVVEDEDDPYLDKYADAYADDADDDSSAGR